MKKQIKFKSTGLKKLTRDAQKKIAGGYIFPDEPDGCGWNMCRNQFGRCSVFAC